MPPARQITKNTREVVRVGPSRYQGHDLVDIRIYVPLPGQVDLGPTKKGISLNVDLVPELIAALEWALLQDGTSEKERSIPAWLEADQLADTAWEELRKHGSKVHWDIIQRLVNRRLRSASKHDLHYVLTSRRDLFQACGNGTFNALDK